MWKALKQVQNSNEASTDTEINKAIKDNLGTLDQCVRSACGFGTKHRLHAKIGGKNVNVYRRMHLKDGYGFPKLI